MEIHEVKIGDVVSFKHKGKTMKGKIIHRHDSKNSNASLAGHVNVQGTGDASYPVTIHAAKLTPVPSLKEEDSMDNLTENIENLLDHIHADENIEAENAFDALMQHKINELLSNVKIEVAQDMFNTNECADCEAEEVDEALKGNQHKIDANKNGKVDAHDFKLLRKKKGVKEDVEDLDEISQKTKDSYVAKRGSQLSSMMYGSSKNYNLLSGKKQANAVKGIKQALNKEEVEQVDELSKQALSTYIKKAGPQIAGLEQKHGITSKPAMKRKRGVTRASINYLKKDLGMSTTRKEEVAHEAYSDPYAAKKSAEMKKAHAATMADAKKEYDAARKPKFAKNFMKMKKEEVELEEGNAENKMKKNAYADAKGAANKYGALDRGSQRRVDRQRTDEVDSIKKGIDNYAPKKAPVRSIIRGKVFGKLSDTETKIFARKRVKEDVNLQELDANTLRSYISKRAKPGQLDAARKGDSTAKKQVKGISNANASLTKKYKSKLDTAYNNAAAASYNKAKPGTYHGD